MRRVWINIGITSPLLIFFIVLMRLPSVAAVPDSLSWRVVGQVGGPTSAVVVQGNTAYVGVGLRLIVLDVSDPITPTEVGSTTPFPYFVEGIAISGTHAYVATGGAGLRVVDITTPTAPVEVGFWDSPGYAEGVTVAGGTVYLADGPYGLWAVDVSDPAHPTPVGAAYDMNYAFEVTVSGDYAYIAAAGAGLLIADVSDPAHPVEVGTLNTPGYAYGVAVSGTLAYVADGWEGVQVVDITDPTHPALLGACDTPGWALSVAVAESIVYVADGESGLRLVDISEPERPHEISAAEGFGLARRVAVTGSIAYVADLRGGLRIIDVAEPDEPAQASLYSPLAEARRVTVAGDYAYVAAGFSGLRVVSISDPSHPQEVGAYDTEGGYAASVVVSDSYAYLAAYISGLQGLHVVDVSDPVTPVRAGSLFTDPYNAYRDLALQSQTIYVANEWGLRLINVSNPVSPTLLGFVPLGSFMSTSAVAVTETLAYVATGGYGLSIVDVSDALSPTLIGTYDSPGYAVGVAVSGSQAYVADSQDGVSIAGVSTPSLPVEIGGYDTPGNAESVTISGSTAYVSDGGGGLLLLDVSNPFTPTRLAAYDTPGYAWQASVQGDYAYVADGHGGLLILEKVNNGWTTGSAAGQPISHFQGAGGAEWRRVTQTSAPSSTGVSANRSIRRESGLASTCVVTSTNDSGSGSLRQCLIGAGSGDTITFDPVVFPPAHPVTISLAARLPTLAQGQLTIDASDAGVILDGENIAEESYGLLITSDGNMIRGLQIIHFDIGVFIDYGGYNIVGGDRLQGTGPVGQGNLISGNGSGIHIQGQDAISNSVLGNLIGTDITGSDSMGNERMGVSIYYALRNTVGGTSSGTRNVISGNETGINLNTGAEENVVAGNLIGTDLSGTRALGNRDGGVSLGQGASRNVIGGTTPEERNVISGHTGGCGNGGVLIGDPGSTHNVIIGNYIGTDISGRTALGNDNGVRISSADFNLVKDNLISGNTTGVSIHGLGANHNLILGNYIGTDVSGSQALPNGRGVSISIAGAHNFIGGPTVDERNTISASDAVGVDLDAAGVEYNLVVGNIIGADANGVSALGNRWAGVLLENYSLHSFVQANVVAYNGGAGPYNAGIYVTHSSFNTLRRNAIHDNAGSSIALSNGGNQMLPAPTILTATETSASGTACPGCTVEVFSDAEDEGRVYEGNTAADGAGVFAFAKPAGLSGPFITATSTDPEGNTSEFSTAQRVWRQIYLPIVLKGQ